MHAGTGAGVIFGATGGVMEAALRTAYFTLKGENPPADAFKAVRSGGFQEMPEFRKRNLPSVTSRLRIAAVSGLGNTEDFYSRSSAARSTMICRSHGLPRAAVSAAADSRSAMVRSWRLREEESIRWMRNQNSGTRMRTRISGRSTEISLESRCPTRRICCCIRSIGKIIKVSVKLRIQKKHVDTEMKKQLILCRKFKSNVCER